VVANISAIIWLRKIFFELFFLEWKCRQGGRGRCRNTATVKEEYYSLALRSMEISNHQHVGNFDIGFVYAGNGRKD